MVDACGVMGPLRRECSTSERAVQVTSAGRVLWVAAPRLLRRGELRAHLASDPRAVCVLASLSLWHISSLRAAGPFALLHVLSAAVRRGNGTDSVHAVYMRDRSCMPPNTRRWFMIPRL